jgi:SLT domain-containing protein
VNRKFKITLPLTNWNIPMLASGGIVTSPQLALIGEKGPEAVIPLSKMGDMGGGSNVTINVNGGDPNAVVAALRTYMRQNGSIPIKTNNAY